MILDVRASAHKAVRIARPDRPTELGHSARWVQRRYGVSPSLARTIAELALLGGGQ
jgi:hypothetical protein